MGNRVAMTPVCFKYRTSGIMALRASAICVCWMHIWGIKVRKKYISVWYRHGICFFIVYCTLSLSLLLRQMPKVLCLYMKNVCIWVYTCVYICIYWWAGAGGGTWFAVRLSCTSPQKFINVYVYVYVLVREGCRPTTDALGLRFPSTGPSMCSNIRTEDGYSAHNPAFCHDVYVTHTPGVKNRYQCPMRDCGVSTRANICLHGEPTAPYLDSGLIIYIYVWNATLIYCTVIECILCGQ